MLTSSPFAQDPLAERDYKGGRLAAAARVVHNEGWGIGCSMCLSVRPTSFDIGRIVH
jgi:hypothetical protein